MVRDDLHFTYDADEGVYRLAYTDPAAPQYPPDTVLETLDRDGWSVENLDSGPPVDVSHSDPDMHGVIGDAIELDLGVRLSPLKQYEMEYILRGGESADTVADLVEAERDSDASLIYD